MAYCKFNFQSHIAEPNSKEFTSFVGSIHILIWGFPSIISSNKRFSGYLVKSLRQIRFHFCNSGFPFYRILRTSLLGPQGNQGYGDMLVSILPLTSYIIPENCSWCSANHVISFCIFGALTYWRDFPFQGQLIPREDSPGECAFHMQINQWRSHTSNPSVGFLLIESLTIPLPKSPQSQNTRQPETQRPETRDHTNWLPASTKPVHLALSVPSCRKHK